MRRKWLSLLPICRVPKYDSTLEILFLTACADSPPCPFQPIGPKSPGRWGGTSSPSALVWADWLEWPVRKISTGSKKQDL